MIDLYMALTPNGRTASVTLEEEGCAYKTYAIDLARAVQKELWFLEVCPNQPVSARSLSASDRSP